MDEGYIRFRWRIFIRRLKRWRRKLADFSQQFIGRYVLRRTKQLRDVQRFVLVWGVIFAIALVGLLIQLRRLDQYYLVAGGSPGGTITEGMVGEIPLINPLYPETPAARAANKLIFSGLTHYNGVGKIEADLAESWQVDETGKVYTVRLRPNVLWHDGKPFTAKDVAFTFRLVQNRNANSPLYAAWKDVAITTPDDYTVVFTLPIAYAPFLDSLTTGILPAHLLQTAEPSGLRKIEFNQNPIGTGPFKFKDFSLDRGEVRTIANPEYYLGKPLLEGFTFKLFSDQSKLLEAYLSHSITTAAGLDPASITDISGGSDYSILDIPTSNQAFTFLNVKQPILSDQSVRQALVQATDPTALTEQLPTEVTPTRSALLPEHIGFNAKFAQLPPDITAANTKLEGAGWVMGEDGFRHKDDQVLAFELVTQDNGFFPDVAQLLQQQWQAAGVELTVKLVDQSELQSKYLRPRQFDMVLTALSLGGDPDVYPFWHSSQVGAEGLNLSQYTSETADQELEGGRTRIDAALRQAKYENFLAAWRDDAPAIALFRLDFNYGIRNTVHGIDAQRLVTPEDRFYNVQDWTGQPGPVLKRLVPTPIYELVPGS